MANKKIKLFLIVREISLALGLGLLALLILESLWKGSVLAYINLNYWLILWLISVTILLFINNPNHTDERFDH